MECEQNIVTSQASDDVSIEIYVRAIEEMV